jgi:hypothetical protein
LLVSYTTQWLSTTEVRTVSHGVLVLAALTSNSVPELYQAIHALLVSKGLTKSAKALGKEAELLEDTPAAQEQVQKLLGAWELINVTV